MSPAGTAVGDAGTDPERDTTRPARALLWSIANTVSARLGTLAISIALARLLGPEEFGTYAVAFVALMAILSFNELGVSLAIVRQPGDPAAIAPTVATVSIATSAALTAAMLVAAPWFTAAMGDPDATGPVRVLALCVLVNGIVATPAALMQRRFQQGRRTVADQLNVWIGAASSLALALVGLGAMSLAVGRLAGSLASAAVLVRYSPLPLRLGYDPGQVRALLRFGLPLAGASVVVFLVGFLDQVVVGIRLGPLQLGLYVLAANLALWPVGIFSQPLRAVAPALFARLQDDPAAMSRAFPRVLGPLAAVAFPACAALGVAAPSLIVLVYGHPWAPAAVVLPWLAGLAAYRVVVELSYDYLVVLGRSRAVLLLQLAWAAALLPAVWVGATAGGLAGAATAPVVAALVVSLPLYLAELVRAGVSARSVVRALALPCALTSVAVAAVVGAGGLLDGHGERLVVTALATAAAAALGVYALRRDLAVLRLPPGVQL